MLDSNLWEFQTDKTCLVEFMAMTKYDLVPERQSKERMWNHYVFIVILLSLCIWDQSEALKNQEHFRMGKGTLFLG